MPDRDRTVRFGPHDLVPDGDRLGELRDANDLLDDPPALRARLDEDGCLLIRGLHDRELVLAARRELAAALAAAGALDASAAPDELVPAPGHDGGFFGGADGLSACAAFRRLVTHERIMGFCARLLGGAVRTFDYRWLRVVGPGGRTGSHIDRVYMGRGTDDLYTCWTPLGDVPYELGPLAVCLGSHRLPGFARVHATYGRMDVDRDHVHGAFSDDPLEIVERFGGRWATTEFRAGDALVFGMRAMHASLTNTSGRLRLSSDTRYQRADAPVDERWVGERPIAHYAWDTPGKNIDMRAARAAWGV